MNLISPPGRELSPGDLSETRRSKLRQVLEQLRQRKDLYFAGMITYPNYGSAWVEAVDIIVAPVISNYSAEKLNKFMKTLVVGIEPTTIDEARHYDPESDFQIGKLYFDEDLGVRKSVVATNVTAYELEPLERAGVNIGESHSTHDERLQRRTWVRVYPDATLAKLVAEYESGISEGTIEYNPTFNYLMHWITPEQMRALKEKRNPLSKISGFLGR